MEVRHTLCTQNFTKVQCEDEWKYNAPHHFVIKNVKTDEIVGKVDMQEGPINEVGINGINNEDLILIVLSRLEAFQNSPYRCNENYEAICSLEEALVSLRERTNKRKQRGVEGTSAI